MEKQGRLSGDDFLELALEDAILATDRYDDLLAECRELERKLALQIEISTSRGEWIIERKRLEAKLKEEA